MPMYEYKCAKCGTIFELLQKFSDKPLKTHEGCGGAVERLISTSSFRLKGSGWYATDYGRKNGSGSNGSKSGEPHKSTTASPATETKTESKPAATPAPKS